MIKKKGIQLNQAFGAVLAVVLVAVLVIIAIFLFEALGDGFIDQSTIVANETGAYINATGYTLDTVTACNWQSAAITSAANATDGTTILVGNYTLSSAGVLSNATVTNYADVNLAYTYVWGGEACTATESMVTQFGTYPALVGLVGTIVFLGLVIGVLVGSFVFGGRGRV